MPAAHLIFLLAAAGVGAVAAFIALPPRRPALRRFLIALAAGCAERAARAYEKNARWHEKARARHEATARSYRDRAQYLLLTAYCWRHSQRLDV